MLGAKAVSLVNASVLAVEGQLHSSMRIAGESVTSLGESPRPGDVVIDLDGDLVLPGLINAHDHLELNSFPRLKWQSQYVNVRDWIADFQPRFKTDPVLEAARPDTLADRVWVGGLKNLLAGVTTVCHHNPIHPPLRGQFPVRIVRDFGMSHSLQIDGLRVGQSYRNTPPWVPWIIHAAEGIDAAAREEIVTLASMGCLGPNTVLVHGVAIGEFDAELVLGRGGALVWCPSSNDFLFGRTADVRQFAERRALALGTDSRLSGEGDLLDELRAASRTGQLTPEALVRAVTVDAAAMLRLRDAGRIEVGKPADLTVIRRKAEFTGQCLIAATRADVRLTMIGGAPLIGDNKMSALFAARGESCLPAQVDGAHRLVATWIAKRAARLTLLEPGFEVAA